MSEELHASNESLSRLWQSQAVSRQARASEVIVGETSYQPLTPIEFQPPEPIVARPESLPIEHGQAFVIDHLPDPAAREVSPAKERTRESSARSKMTAEGRPPSSRKTDEVQLQRRNDERRTSVDRERHGRAIRTSVARHEETSRAVRPENFGAISPPIAPRPVGPVAPMTTPTWDVRRPAAPRTVDAPAVASREMQHPRREPSHLAHSLLGGLDQHEEATRSSGEESVNVVA